MRTVVEIDGRSIGSHGFVATLCEANRERKRVKLICDSAIDDSGKIWRGKSPVFPPEMCGLCWAWNFLGLELGS